MTTQRHDEYPENETSSARYWANKDAQMQAEIAEDAAYAQTAAAIQRQIIILEGFTVRENTDPATWATKHAALTAKLDAAREREAAAYADAQAITDAAWTAEITAERKASWNEMIRSGKCNLRNGQISPAKVAEAERTQGWTMADLKRAITRHAQ